MKTAIIIATYNEAENIKELLDQLKNYDVYIVDDNSPDGTAKIASSYNNVSVMKRENKRGIASAYIDGFNWILSLNKGYKKIVQMDAGLTHDPNDIPQMLIMSKDCDLLIGSRNIQKQKIKNYRTVISKFAVLLMSLIGIKYKDVTSGFRVWDIDLLKKIKFEVIESKGFAFQLELLHQVCNQHKAIVKEYFISYKLTNSSFNKKILFEAFHIWMKLLIKTLKDKLLQ